MATDITAWDRAYRAIRYRVEINRVDYSDNIDNITYYQSATDSITGFEKYDLNLALYLESANDSILVVGSTVKVILLITIDNWATTHEETVFYGLVTKGIRNRKLYNITAQNILYLSQREVKTGFGSFASNNVRDMKAMINFFFNFEDYYTGVNYPDTSNDIIFQPMGIIGSIVGGVTDYTRKLITVGGSDYAKSLKNLLTLGCYIIRRKKDNFEQVEGVSMADPTSPTISENITLDQIIHFDNSKNNIDLCNTTEISYQKTSNTATGYYGEVWKNENITGVEIKANSVNFYTVDPEWTILTGVDYSTFFPYPNTGDYSRYQLATADDGTGFSNSGATISGFLSLNDRNYPKVIIKITNNNAYSIWLKKIVLWGFYDLITELTTLEDNNPALVTLDGSTITKTIDTPLSTSAETATTSSNYYLNSFNTSKKTYSFVAKGRPTRQVGDIISFENEDLVVTVGRIIEIDSEISRDRGFEQTILIKEI
jgi:hypothetical protein